MATATRPVERRTQGKIKARRLTGIGTGALGEQELDPGPAFRNFTCRNDGANALYLRFNDDVAPQHWTLLAGASLPVSVEISPTTVIKVRAASGTSDLECLLWG